MYKLVSGDFVVTTEVLVTNRNGVSVPSSIFSLAGILIRSPLSYTNGQAGWSSGEQNYIFLSVGTADNTCTPSPCVGQLEVKTTVNSNSTLSITDIPDTHVQLRFARIDSAFIILYRHVAGGNWIVHQRYNRPDFPDTLQVGFTTYTDWPKVQGVGVNFHNNNVLIPGVANDPQPGVGFNPDLIANFDFYRIDSVTCPITINCNALTNSGMVSTNDLLGFLGYDSTPYCPDHFRINQNTIDHSWVSNQADTISISSTLTSNSNTQFISHIFQFDPDIEISNGVELSITIGDCMN